MISRAIKSAKRGAEDRLVLLLQADTAYWFKVSRQQIDRLHSQCIGSMVTDVTSVAPWLHGKARDKPVEVELVLDTVLDEVDVVTVEQSPYALVNRYRQWVTLRRLRADYPDARVSPIPEGYADKTASLTHLVIPDTWNSWLSDLQSHDVVFTRVITGTQIVENWACTFEKKMLLVMPVARYQRHVLIDQGATLALRTAKLVQERDSEAIYDQQVLQQTLQQLEPELIDAEDSLDIVVPQPQPASQEAERELLIAMFSDFSIKATQLVFANNTRVEVSRKPPVANSSLSKVAPIQRVMLRVSCVLQRCFRRFAAKPAGGSFKQSLAWAMPAFFPSVAYYRATQRRRLLSGAAVLSACAASVVTLWVISERLQYHRITGQRLESHRQLEQDSKQIRQAAAAEHADPTTAARSLWIHDQLNIGYALSPDDLLESLGTVLTSTDSVFLNTLIWASTEAEENYESLTYVLSSVPQRLLADKNAKPAVLQVEIAGLVAEDTLNTQKTAFDQFVKALESIAGLGSITVLESPVDRALSSDTNDKTQGRFQLNFMVRSER